MTCHPGEVEEKRVLRCFKVTFAMFYTGGPIMDIPNLRSLVKYPRPASNFENLDKGGK